MKQTQHTKRAEPKGAPISRRRFFHHSGAAILSTALLTSCDDLIDKIIPSKEDKRDKTVAFFGDSLTIGIGASEPLGKWVGDALPERRIVTDGINGQVALSIAIRQGGVPLKISVEGQKFNGPKALRVTKLNNEFLSTPLNNKVYTRNGTLVGVKCSITRTVGPEGGEVYMIEPLAETSDQAAAQSADEAPLDKEIPDDSVFELEDAVTLKTATQVLWYGRNDMTEGKPEDEILADIEQSVAYIAEPRRYLVLGILPASIEDKGTDRYNKLEAFNSRLAVRYGNSYVPMTPPTDSEMKAIGFTPTGEDKAEIERGNFPPGMRPANTSDQIHLNNYGYRIIANRIVSKIKDLKY